MTRRKSGIDRLNILKASSIVSGSRSYVSLGYGVLAVIVVFAIVFLGLRALSQRNTDIGGGGQTEAENAYVVKKGDSLWTIAEEVYDDGFKWTIIAEENSLERPDVIEVGMKLTIPEVSETPPITMEEISPTPTQESPTTVPLISDGEKITENSYRVVRDDNLWSIAVRAYGDGYKWVEIAKANKLVNPNVIHAGNKFTLPR